MAVRACCRNKITIKKKCQHSQQHLMVFIWLQFSLLKMAVILICLSLLFGSVVQAKQARMGHDKNIEMNSNVCREAYKNMALDRLVRCKFCISSLSCSFVYYVSSLVMHVLLSLLFSLVFLLFMILILWMQVCNNFTDMTSCIYW